MFWLLLKAVRESFAVVGGTFGTVALWVIAAAATTILVLLFRGRGAFMEHVKANILIVIGGAAATWILVLLWTISWLPHNINQRAAHIQLPPPLRAHPLPPDIAYVSTRRGKGATPTAHIKYFSTQTIEVKMSDITISGGGALNLDNAARLVQFGPPSRDVIELLFSPASAPLRIDTPRAGEKYEVGGGLHAEFPSAGKSVQIGSAMFGEGQMYTFRRLESPTHLVTVGARRFRVTLQDVRDQSSGQQIWIIYTFAISEE